MDYVEFGVILKPQGIRGELKIKYSPFGNFDPLMLKILYLNEEDTYKEYHVQSMRLDQRYAYAKLKGIEDRNEAEKIRNAKAYVKRSDVSLPEGMHYISDLVGLEVLDDEGRRLGILTEVIETGSADVYVVKENNTGFMFPALKRVILKTDLEAKTMTVDKKTLAEVAVYGI